MSSVALCAVLPETSRAKAIRAPDVRQRLPEESFDLIASTAEQFARYVEEESAKYAKIVQQANITAE